jgi:hypothetical protein
MNALLTTLPLQLATFGPTASAPTDKVDQLKWLNEIQHRVTAKIIVLRTHDHDGSELDSWIDIEHWIGQDTRNEARVLCAISAALQAAKLMTKGHP